MAVDQHGGISARPLRAGRRCAVQKASCAVEVERLGLARQALSCPRRRDQRSRPPAPPCRGSVDHGLHVLGQALEQEFEARLRPPRPEARRPERAALVSSACGSWRSSSRAARRAPARRPRPGHRPARRALGHGGQALGVFRGRRPSRSRRKAATSASGQGRKSSRRQRERMVGKRRPGAWQTSSSTPRGGGSSRVFRTALAALGLRSSAASMIATRQGERPATWRRTPAAGGPRRPGCCAALPSSTSARAPSGPDASGRSTWRLTGSLGIGAQQAMRRSGRRRAAGARRGRRKSPCRRPPARSAARRGASGRAPAASAGLLGRFGVVEAKTSRGWARRPARTPSRSCTAPQIAAATPRAAGGVDHDAALRLGGGDLQEGLRAAARGTAWPLASKRTPRRRGRAARGQARLHRQVQDQGEVGLLVADHVLLQRRDQRLGRAAGRRPGRRGWNSAKRSQITQAPRSSAGRITFSRWSRRAAYINSVSLVGRPALGAALQQQRRGGPRRLPSRRARAC